MSKRSPILVAAVALLAAACARTSAAELDLGEGRQFVPEVADFLDDVGMDPSIVLDDSGIPHLVYFGFTQQPKKGEIPVQRPVTAPTVPAIMLLTEDKGVFSRGAVAMQSIPPLVDWPTGPVGVSDLATISPTSVNGTAIALDASGGTYAAWTADTGLWFASNTGNGFSASNVVKLDPPAQQPGPLGAPGVAVDASGMPWVAYAHNSQDGFQVVAAMPEGDDSWKTSVVATIEQCSGCDQGLRTAIGATGDGLIVVWADTASGDVMAARSPDGEEWTREIVDAGGGGLGLSLAIDSKGSAHVAYATRIGEIREATSTRDTWNVVQVASPTVGESSYDPSTGVAVDDGGAAYVTWYDSATDSVMVAAEQSGTFVPLPTSHTEGGSSPAVAVAPDGSSLYLAWYDHVERNLMLGVFEDTSDLALAATPPATEQPTSTATTAPPTSACPKGSVKITAPVGSAATGFTEKEITVAAGKPFTVCFDNQDTGVPHNAAFYDKQGGTAFAKTEISNGPAISTVEVPAQEPGEYWFQCDVHPTTMTGKLIAE